MKHDLEKYKRYLERDEKSPNTITNYLSAINNFYSMYKRITKQNLIGYKNHLIETTKPKTVNARLVALNMYLDYIGKSGFRVKLIREQQPSYLENVISYPDYVFFKNELKKEKNLVWYFSVRLLAATGARISELVEFKIEHLKLGYVDLYGKGRKARRIYIPNSLCEEAIEWLGSQGRESGYIFQNFYRKQFTPRGIAIQLKNRARKYGMNVKAVHPHSFRHLFARCFIDKYNDIALLADLMGHEKIDTTRIYLRRSGIEQQAIVNKVVTW